MNVSADRVVVVVFDGLRPDMIAGRMPNLEAFAGDAVWFREARSVFPSYTRVATTSTATGCWPEHHGIVGNTFHQPELLGGEPIDTSNFGHLELLRSSDPSGLVHRRSLGERLAAAGKRMAAIHCGSAGSAFLINHRASENGHWTLSPLGREGTQTPDILEKAAVLGPLPSMDIPKFDVVDYAARAFRHFASDAPADVTIVWFPEPDTSYHYREIGSDPTRAVMGAVDDAFGAILETIRNAPDSQRTAIFAMSDHGQISTTELFDIGAEMSAAGLLAAVRPETSHKVALTRGASGECRMLDSDPGLAKAVGEWLMSRPEIGMVFARDELSEAIPGTLPLSLAHLDHPRAAELMYVMRSSSDPDKHGLAGSGGMTGGVPVGGGMHGGLNRLELNTTLMVSAPGAEGGVVSTTPCGLVDITPTICALLGLPASDMDGEPLPLADQKIAAAELKTHTAGHLSFEQELTIAERNGRSYLMEGRRLS